MERILVTGGAGYIGSHTVLLLLEAGFDVVVLDNFSNSSVESLKRVEALTSKKVLLIEGDIRDEDCLKTLFADHEDTNQVVSLQLLEKLAKEILYRSCKET